MDNSATVELPKEDFIKFLQQQGVEYESLNLLEVAEKAEAGGDKGNAKK
jgi:hypothetical protein